MPAKSVLNAIALSVFLIASILVFVTVSHVGFIGVGVIGLLLWVICNLVELDAPASLDQNAAFFARREQLRAEERAADVADRLLSLQSIRFYRYLGAALSVIGIGGFVLFQI